MAAQQTFSRSLLSITGAILLIVGLLLIFANLDEIAARITNSLTSPAETLGIFPALGLAGLRAMQAYFFDHPQFLSALRQILVSFWPLLLVVAGAVLMRRTMKGRSALHGTGTATSTRVERE